MIVVPKHKNMKALKFDGFNVLELEEFLGCPFWKYLGKLPVEGEVWFVDFGDGATIGNLGSGRFSIISSEELENLFDFQFPEFGVDESKLSFFQLEALKVLEPILGKYLKYHCLSELWNGDATCLSITDAPEYGKSRLVIFIYSEGYIEIYYYTPNEYPKPKYYRAFMWEEWIIENHKDIIEFTTYIRQIIEEDRNPF